MEICCLSVKEKRGLHWQTPLGFSAIEFDALRCYATQVFTDEVNPQIIRRRTAAVIRGLTSIVGAGIRISPKTWLARSIDTSKSRVVVDTTTIISRGTAFTKVCLGVECKRCIIAAVGAAPCAAVIITAGAVILRL